MYRSMGFFFCVAAVGFTFVMPGRGAENRMGLDATQMVVCIAPTTASFEGTLQRFHRDAAGHWQKDGDSWPVLFARKGLAWGRGLHPAQPGPQKISDDHRNPAGLFKIGYALGYAARLPEGAQGWPYHRVTDRDAWIDDPALPGYNHLFTLQEGAERPAWWEKEKLELGDHAYEWMLVIEHNYDGAAAGAGTNIFFHVRRGEHYRTAGCTTMERGNLLELIKWLKPGSNAMLAEMSREDYRRFWKAWGLPPAGLVLGGFFGRD